MGTFSPQPQLGFLLEQGTHLAYLHSSDTFSGNGTPRQSVKGQETPVHDSLIEERLQRERPCRTLFIRNIKVGATHSGILVKPDSSSQYETDSREFRLKFEEFGEIKTFFDLISHRGMVFCTYVCLLPCLVLLSLIPSLVRHEGGRTRQRKATRHRSCWSPCKWFVSLVAFETNGRSDRRPLQLTSRGSSRRQEPRHSHSYTD